MADKRSYLERLVAKIEEQIDAEIEAVERALEVEDPRPFGAHKLNLRQQMERFAMLPDAEKVRIFSQSSPEEQQTIVQGLAEMGLI